jgi:hypothetical protein
MENKENILQELQQISLTVAAISGRNVFTIPDGYFEALANEVLAAVHMANWAVVPVPYTVPANYFDGLPAVVMTRIREEELLASRPALDEIPGKIFAYLPASGVKNPYGVPAGYFDTLAEAVMGRIAVEQAIEKQDEVYEELEEIAPLLNTISRKTPYGVPAGYFESLVGSFAGNAANDNAVEPTGEVYEELKELAPLLNSIGKSSPYTVPENYFEQFTVSIPTEEPVAKVVRMQHSKTRWVAWLAAACITAIVATGGFLFWQAQGVVKPTPTLDVTKSLSDVSDEDISNYLDSMPAPGAETIPTSVIDEHGPDVEPVIQNLSTDEIKEYLQNNSDPGEKSAKDI